MGEERLSGKRSSIEGTISKKIMLRKMQKSHRSIIFPVRNQLKGPVISTGEGIPFRPKSWGGRKRRAKCLRTPKSAYHAISGGKKKEFAQNRKVTNGKKKRNQGDVRVQNDP